MRPSIVTAASAVFARVLDARTPVAEVLPEAAVVTPVEAPLAVPPVLVLAAAVGASATLIPDLEVAALESTIVLVCWFSTVKPPVPPAATPELSWVLLVVVSASPAVAAALPLLAAVADCGVFATAGATPLTAIACAVAVGTIVVAAAAVPDTTGTAVASAVTAALKVAAGVADTGGVEDAPAPVPPAAAAVLGPGVALLAVAAARVVGDVVVDTVGAPVGDDAAAGAPVAGGVVATGTLVVPAAVGLVGAFGAPLGAAGVELTTVAALIAVAAEVTAAVAGAVLDACEDAAVVAELATVVVSADVEAEVGSPLALLVVRAAGFAFSLPVGALVEFVTCAFADAAVGGGSRGPIFNCVGVELFAATVGCTGAFACGTGEAVGPAAEAGLTVGGHQTGANTMTITTSTRMPKNNHRRGSLEFLRARCPAYMDDLSVTGQVGC